MKEETLAPCENMDDLEGIMLNMSEGERPILYDLTHMWNLEKGKLEFIETESVGGGQGWPGETRDGDLKIHTSSCKVASSGVVMYSMVIINNNTIHCILESC